MKILQVIPNLQKGGAERLVLDICNELQKREDVKVKLLVLHPENEYEFLSKNIDVEFCNSSVVPSVSGKNNVDLSEYNKIVSEFNPQIVHSHLFEAEMVSRWETIPGIRYFTHCHDNMMQFQRFTFNALMHKKRLTDFYERNLLFRRYGQCNNQFIAISKNTVKSLEQNLPRQLNNITLLHNAIDYARFYCIRKRNIHHGSPVRLVNIGSFLDKKNQIFLIRVVDRLRARGYEVVLDLLGDGQNRGLIEREIVLLGLQEHIFLHGNVDNVEHFLQKADIYVHSALYEPFGLVLLEAMAAGLPVVCLDGGGNRDIIEEGKNGFMVNEQNPELFAEIIIQIISNNEFYQAMSKYANGYAKKYDIKEYVDKLIEIYQQP